jgi:hypothetical protein
MGVSSRDRKKQLAHPAAKAAGAGGASESPVIETPSNERAKELRPIGISALLP